MKTSKSSMDDITHLQSLISHEISLDADKRDYHLLEKKLNEYFIAINVDIDALAEQSRQRIIKHIRKLHEAELDETED